MTLLDVLFTLLQAVMWTVLSLFILAGIAMGVLMFALATYKPCPCEKAGWPCKKEKGGKCPGRL